MFILLIVTMLLLLLLLQVNLLFSAQNSAQQNNIKLDGPIVLAVALETLLWLVIELHYSQLLALALPLARPLSLQLPHHGHEEKTKKTTKFRRPASQISWNLWSHQLSNLKNMANTLEIRFILSAILPLVCSP